MFHRARHRFERAARVTGRSGLLRHAHRERGGRRTIALVRELLLGERGCVRRVAEHLRNAHARADDRVAKERVGIDFRFRRRFVGHRWRLGNRSDRAIQKICRASELATKTANVRRAQIRIHQKRAMKRPTRNAELGGSVFLRERLSDERRLRFERVGVRVTSSLGFFASGETRVALRETLCFECRRESRARTERACLRKNRERPFDLAACRRHASYVEKKKRFPSRIARAFRSLGETLLAKRAIPELCRDELERQCDACLLGHRRERAGAVGDVRFALFRSRQRFERRAFRDLDVVLNVFRVCSAHHERARFLRRRLRRAHECVDHAPQIFERASPLEKTHERFEWLAKRRVRVERGEVIAGGGGLVAFALGDVAGFAEQTRLASFVLRRADFRAKKRSLSLCAFGHHKL